MRVLGVNAVFHDPAAALVVDGQVVAAAEEERFTRRKHGKPPVPFATWELPERSAAWCLAEAGLSPDDLDAVAYSYDPALAPPAGPDVTADAWEGLRTLYAQRAPMFLRTALPGLDPACVRYVPHHVAHAASAHLAAPYRSSSVLVLDGRGEAASHLAGRSVDGDLEILAAQRLPHSLGLLYEEVTDHLGFRRSSDEYKVMALAAYGKPAYLRELREAVRVTGDGGFTVAPIELDTLAKRRGSDEEWTGEHADLAASVQLRLQEVLLELVGWLHAQTGDRDLTMAGGVALNCVANSVLAEQGPFERIWVQPAAGDAGTALGAAMHVAHALGDRVAPMSGAALGRGWTDDELAAWLATARVAYERPPDLADAVAEVIAADGVVAWFQGRSEYGPRALGHRSLLANATRAANLERLNDVKGREQFRPVAPMVLAERAGDIFEGPMPSPYMLFTHRVRPAWRERIPAVVHVDGSARIQTVDRAERAAGRRPAGGGRAAHRGAGGRQHQPQHRRAADGRRPPRRARVLRVGAGRRPRPRAVPGPASRLHQAMTFDVVVPTVGRNSLRLLLAALAAADGPAPGRVLVVDDRRDRSGALPLGGVAGVSVIEGRGAGPAAARNLGWRRATAEWVAFLDDDVVPGPSWLADLAHDLEGLEAEVAASQGRVRVPMPAGRRPTDWERNVRGLETARWATADMAYRRSVLEEVGGFDERFPRAYREDADLGLRVVRSGYRIVAGRRVVDPSGPGGRGWSACGSRRGTRTTC